MKKIFKYQLPIQEKHELQLPLASEIIRVDDVDGMFFLWAIVNPDEQETESRFLEFYKTGQPIETPNGLNYLGMCKIFIMQELGLYVFERVEPLIPYTS